MLKRNKNSQCVISKLCVLLILIKWKEIKWQNANKKKIKKEIDEILMVIDLDICVIIMWMSRTKKNAVQKPINNYKNNWNQ